MPWEDAPAPSSGWQDAPAPDKKTSSKSEWEDSDELKPTAASLARTPLGMAEALAAGVGGMATGAVKGIAGLGGALQSGLTGQGFGKGWEEGYAGGSKLVKPVEDVLEPETPEGQKILKVLGIPFDLAHKGGEKVFEKTGSPAAGAAAEAIPDAALMLLPGFRRGEAPERPTARATAPEAPTAPPADVAPPGAPPLKPATPPEPVSDTVKLYRGQKAGDVGEWHTPDKELAKLYGPELHAVDVPRAVYEDAAKVSGDLGVRIPPEYARKATKVEDVAPLPTYDVEEIGAGEPDRGVERMRGEIGWADYGGHATRGPADFREERAHRLHQGSMPYLEPQGEIEGRTQWTPKSDFWPNRPDARLKEHEAHQALDKYLAGEKLKPIEQRFVDYALKETQARDFEDLMGETDPAAKYEHYQAVHQAAGLEFNHDNAMDVARAARAQEINPEAYARIPDQADDATYKRAIEEILANDHGPNQESAPGGGAPPSDTPALSEAGGGPAPGGTGAGPPPPPPGAPPEGPATPPTPEGAPGLRHQDRMPVEVEQRKPNALADAVRKVLAPATRGPEAAKSGRILRANLGELAHSTQVAQAKLGKFGDLVDKLTDDERYRMMDDIEGGRPQTNARLQPVADEMRALLDERRLKVQRLGTGALQSFIEDYFPHIWKDPIRAASSMEDIAKRQFGKRPLAGSGDFLKQRSIPTIAEGRAAGLEPVTSNPIDLTLLKLREMDKFVFGTRVMQEMKAEGLAQFVKFGRSAPEGWIRLDDKAARVLQWDEDAQGFILRGHYYSPEPAGTIINNHLGPGLQGNAIYDVLRGTGNMLNMAQLGFSAFHLGFTTLDAMVSKTALGIEQIAAGNVGKGVANMAAGTVPGINLATAVRNVLRGNELNRAYENPGIGGPMLQELVKALSESGGRVKMDQFYNAAKGGSYWNSIANRRLLQDFTRNGVAKGAIEFFPRLVQTISAPIMEYLVPRQKLGVFSDLMRDSLEREPNMTPDRMREVGGKIWDSVDNRLGELVYDNLFWNKTLKDLSFLAVRSVGWNLGTIREIGGGAIDYARAGRDLAQGNTPQMTHKMAYVAALPIVAGVWGATLTYLMTGKGPQELKDYIFPRTGRLTKDGYPERLSPPTYMKDMAEYYHAPAQTLVNKTNPLIGVVSQMYKNEDFYGAQIRDLDADPLKQFEQELTYLGKQMLPFSLRGAQRQKEEGAPVSEQAMSFLGFPPAPAYITRPEEVERAIERRRDLPAIRKRMRQESQQ